MIFDFFVMIAIENDNRQRDHHGDHHDNQHGDHYDNHGDHLPCPVDEKAGSDEVEEAEEGQHHHHRNGN